MVERRKGEFATCQSEEDHKVMGKRKGKLLIEGGTEALQRVEGKIKELEEDDPKKKIIDIPKY